MPPKEVTVATDQSSGNYNKSMDFMDSMNMKNMKVKSNNCNLSDYDGALKLHPKILSTGDELNNLPIPTVEVEVYHVWWEFDTDTFPPLSLLIFPHHGGILSWWECAGKPSKS